VKGEGERGRKQKRKDEESYMDGGAVSMRLFFRESATSAFSCCALLDCQESKKT
jgi:hypothetical protein